MSWWIFLFIAIAGLYRLYQANDEGPDRLNLVGVTLGAIVLFILGIPLLLVAVIFLIASSPFISTVVGFVLLLLLLLGVVRIGWRTDSPVVGEVAILGSVNHVLPHRGSASYCCVHLKGDISIALQ